MKPLVALLITLLAVTSAWGEFPVVEQGDIEPSDTRLAEVFSAGNSQGHSD